ncbi:MurR/RpiR family transcriptional regulator [Vagococcus fluvialis]|uniref:MurR/RpiR family transcriptional regulator n=1 Tax=Vagococcus fluvialis TaxID=2738 RepID=UPI001432EA79|nr:MurR/RpiR family transcriptional regulator [Vagococcus fluvialis]NKC58396.1 MurR/RpiR family transcriptional regulator [Vagococcus fluvialis]NKD49372.1 MurR/RpiR family transcriptional regulator [Vagococcus fluvialis]
MSIFEKINMNDLSSVEVEIYKYIVNNLDKVIFMRVRDIALNANVSSTSVFRFIKKLGFASFPEFKLYIKNNLSKRQFPGESHKISIAQRMEDLNLNIFHPDIEYQIEQMAKKIQEAGCLIFLGLGASGAIAEYASRKFANLDYFSVSFHELTYPFHSILKSHQNNVVIALSVSGETKEMIEAIANIEKQASVYSYAITAGKNSNLSRLCDYSIEYFTEEDRKNVFYDLSSQIPAMLIIESVFGYVYDHKVKEINEAVE